MSHEKLLEKLSVYHGKPIFHAIDAIETLAHAQGYSVMVLDPVFNPESIDRDPTRLNIKTGDDGVILSFFFG